MTSCTRKTVLALVLTIACDKQQATAAPEETDAPEPAPAEDEPDAAPKKKKEEDPIATEMTIEGGLTKDQVQKVVDEHFTEVRKCFDIALGHPDDANLTGAIVVRFGVDAEGKVDEQALDDSNFHDPETEQCMVELVRGWTFPKPKGKGAKVKYPFLLRSY
jgi:hypothetical protein